MHERIAYRIYREAGVPAARCNHAQLVINGDDYGLYANVEAVHKRMIARWFEDTEGSMWELADSDFREGYISTFEHEMGEDDRTSIEAVAEALDQSDPDDAIEEVGEHMDLDAFFRFWGASAYTAHLDGYPYSDPGDDAHIYLDPTSGLLHWLPHGVDETFTHSDDWVEYGLSGLLGETCIDSDPCRERFREAVLDTLDVAEGMDIEGYYDEVLDQIEDLAEDDPRSSHSKSQQEDEREYMLDMIEGRRAEFEDQF